MTAVEQEYFGLQGASGGQSRGSETQSRGTKEDVMHNRLDLCQETKLMKVWGRGVFRKLSCLWPFCLS